MASGIRDFREIAAHEGIAMRFFTPGDVDSLAEQLLLALNSPDDLKAMAMQSYAAAVAMSMPRVIQGYVDSFRQHQRIKLLRLLSDMRRGAPSEGREELIRKVAQEIQDWHDEDKSRECLR